MTGAKALLLILLLMGLLAIITWMAFYIGFSGLSEIINRMSEMFHQ